MTGVVGLLLVGGLAVAAIAFVVRASGDGRRAQAVLVAITATAIIGFMLWQAQMVGSVGPAMRDLR